MDSFLPLYFKHKEHKWYQGRVKKKKKENVSFPPKQMKICSVTTCSFLSWHLISYQSNYLSIQTADPFSFWTRAAKSKNELESDQTLHL